MPVKPLAGITVFETDSFVAGPSSCLALSQLGAEVVKIDPIKGGPDIDRWPITASGKSIYWGTLNRNKRSVAINLRDPEGQELAQALITSPGEKSGIFVENNVGREYLSDKVLRAKREDLIHVKVQGSADGGPGVDYTVNASSGIPTITGPATYDGPVNHALPAWDLLCGQAAVTAVTTGLFHRATTGEGLYEEIALKDIALSAVANLGWYTEALQPAGERTKHGNHIFGSLGHDFATHDGRHVMVTAITKRQWQNLVTSTGLGDVITALETNLDTDFAEETNRYTYREVIVSLLKPWFEKRTADQIRSELKGSGVLWAPYETTGEVAQAAIDKAGPEVVRSMESETLGTMLVGAQPIRVNGEYLPEGSETVFGSETEAVLTEKLSLSATELGRLFDAGIIAKGR